MFSDDILNDILDSIDNNAFEDSEDLSQGMMCLSSLEPGSPFYIGEDIYIVLENTEFGECRVIKKDLLRTRSEFGSNADWRSSPIRRYLNEEYYEQVISAIGRDYIIPIQRDLMSWDGVDDYGQCTDKISMLTTLEYAKYRNILGVEVTYPDWWWTITPFSTPRNGYTRGVCCVDSGGALRWDGCGGCVGVRPFFSLDSSLLVSLALE